MLIEEISSNVRLLERLTIFKDSIPAAVGAGSPQALFLQALEALKSDDGIPAAQASLEQLAAALHVPQDSRHLEPLRSLTQIKSWQTGPEGQQKLKAFLIKELGLRFDEDATPSDQPQAPSATDGAAPTAAATPSSLPSYLSPDQYSAAAFQSDLESSGNTPLDADACINSRDPSTLLPAVIDGTLGLKPTVQLLQRGCIPAAAVPVDVLVKVLTEWQADWERSVQQQQQYGSPVWQHSPVVQWVGQHWDDVTAEQATAVRRILPGPPFGSNPDVDRPYAVAQVKKALAGPADARAAAASSSSSRVPLPWQCGAEAAAAAARLQKVLAVCDTLGPPAEWIRVHALYAQLQSQCQQQQAVDASLLNSFMNLLRRCTWSHGGPFGLGQQQQQQQHPTHVSCFACGMRPIVGQRYRSSNNYDINLCSRCVGKPEAAKASPYEEVKVDDSIYMLPEFDLPPVLHGLPSNSSVLEQELKTLIEGVVFEAAVGSEGGCSDAAGLQLPASPWSGRVVSGAHLMSGKGDAAKWVRQYEQNEGSLSALRDATELRFAANSRTTYSLQDDVVLELFTKNMGTEGVLVKVYELNCWKLYTSTQAEADLNLELAGVAPTHTITLNTPADPLVRCRHSVPLGLSGVPGVWLVEVVAGSRRLRGRISKGGLRLWQRPSVAGQVLTILNEEWRPVTGVRVWCDGKQYTPHNFSAANSPSAEGDVDSNTNEVLLPFARDEGSTALVVAAQLPGAAGAGCGGGKECVVLVKDFRRLREQYGLAAQLYCNQEALLPGHTVPLLLLLSLQLHGTAAPLSLLQDLQLSVTATTREGGPVTQVIKDLSLDEHSCSAVVPYTLPPNTSRLSATLTARILLALPGANGEPDYQSFDIQALLPGQAGLQSSVAIEAAKQSSDIFDIYLTTGAPHTPSSQDTSVPRPSYLLQVLGRCGEPPSAPKTLSVWLDHTAFSPSQQLKFRVQTGPGGVVDLGPLGGIRQIRAQIEAGVDCEEGQAAAAAGHDGVGVSGGSATGQHAGPVRSWRIARPSWWVGGLQEQYVMREGGTLEVPITLAAGQSLQASLLHLVSPAVAASSNSTRSSPAHEAAVAADVTSTHLQLGTTTTTDAGTTGSSDSSSTAMSRGLLGCVEPRRIRIKGLAAGLYRLVLPAVLLRPPSGSQLGSNWDQGLDARHMAVHIHVLPAASADAAALTERSSPGRSDVVSTPDPAAGVQAVGQEKQEQETTGVPVQQQWLYASPDGSNINGGEPALLQPSALQHLHITSLTCSATAGLTLKVSGSEQQLQTAQVLLVFSRFFPDESSPAVQLLPPQLPWQSPSTPSGGFGFSPSLQEQNASWGFARGLPQGLGYAGAPQSCGVSAGCSYSRDGKLDSAVAYVLQRRQWEEAGGGRRPGVLLDRPSLLVFPHSVRSAAAATSVLRGGDGGQLREAPKMKKMVKRCPAAYSMQPCAAAMFHAPQYQMAADYDGGGPAFACCAPAVGGFGLGRQVLEAGTPVLSFLAQPAAVLTQLQLGPGGSLHIGPDKLGQLLAGGAVGGSGSGSDVGVQEGGDAGADAASGVDVLAKLGCRVVYAAVYDVKTPGQFGAAWAACEEQGDLGASQRQQQQAGGARAAAACSCLPDAAVRDMGLDRPVDPGVVVALSCDVVVLRQPGESLTLQNPEAAESGVFGSLQQLFQLMAGLLKTAESGGGFMPQQLRPMGAFSSDRLAGLPHPRVPAGAKECASVLLRQWEPLVLQWPLMGPAARQDLLSKLASAELAFFLAVKDRAAYEELLLPLLRCKLPSELSCLEQLLLLQAQHNQPPIPTVHSSGAPSATTAAPAHSSYAVQKQQLLQHWYAPHRFKQLNYLERLLLAALEGSEALLQYSGDLMHQLQSPAEKRGVKRTWMSRERRAVFEFGLLLAQSLEQQQRDAQGSTSDSDHPSDSGDDSDTDATAEGEGSDSDFVKVDMPVAEHSAAPSMFGAIVGSAPPPPPSFGMMPPPPAPMAAPPPAPGGMAFGAAPRKMMAMAGLYSGDLAARAQVASDAADESNQVRVPKETKEWGETGWWKCEGPQPELIPAARFWAEHARHMATQPQGTPFVPSDPTDVAASTAAIIAALAVTDLPWEGAAAAGSGGSSCSSKSRVRASTVGCVRSYQGASLTITAKAPCLLWVKMLKPLVAISPAAEGTAVGAEAQAATAVPAAAAGVPAAGGAAANSVLVVDRLYDPRFASSTDAETGEEVLLALQPSEQQPLLTGQRYCRSVVVTSTVAAERELQLLVQLPQGAMALDGSVGTISRALKLAPYTSMQVQQTFYFPQPGVYLQAPVSVVTVTGRPAWVPSAPPMPLHVVAASSLADQASSSTSQVGHPQVLDPAARWRQLISRGDKAQLLAYLKTGDLSGAQLADVTRFCKDPSFFSAAVSALNSRHMYDTAVWKYAVLHQHGPALKQLLLASQLTQQLQLQYRVPVGRLLDSVFGSSSSSSSSSSSGGSGGSGSAGGRRGDGRAGAKGAGGGVTATAEGGEGGVDDDMELCDQVLRHLEFWPWVNPYCRPITHSGADANLPSVLRDNAAIRQQWTAFLLSLLMDCSSSSSSSSSRTTTGGSSGSSGSRLTVQQATAAAVFLLLQDRVDEAEEVLTAGGCWGQPGGHQLATGPLSMQRDYLTAWLALCRPLVASGAAAAAGGTESPTAAAAVAAGSRCSGQGVPVGDTQERVTAEAIRVGTAVVNKYKSCVAGPWVKRFKQLATLISQLEQQQAGSTAPQSADSAAAPAASPTQPLLSVLGLTGSTLKLHVSGLQQLQLSAYKIDTELLFTTQPFSDFSSGSSSHAAGDFGGAHSSAPVNRVPPPPRGTSSKAGEGLGRVSYVQPTAQVLVQLQCGDAAVDAASASSSKDGADSSTAVGAVCTSVGDPAGGSSSSGTSGSSSGCGVYECVMEVDRLMPGLQQASVLLEVTGGGLSRSLPRFASSLTVHVLESQGVLQAYCQHTAAAAAAGPGSTGHTLTPAAAAYVKVYARDAAGDEFLYKDGYTDLRGRFDYVTLTSTADMSSVVRYSLLVASRGHGAVMLQAAPPPK